MKTKRQEVNRAHRPSFDNPPLVGCTCGKPTVRTYAGWKRHQNAEMRKAGVGAADD